jgi:hypothetical protein
MLLPEKDFYHLKALRIIVEPNKPGALTFSSILPG